MEQENLKRVNIVIVVAYLLGSLLASLGFAFSDATFLFLVETFLGLLIYIFGIIAAIRNYRTYKHKTLIVLMIAGFVLSISLIVLMYQNLFL